MTKIWDYTFNEKLRVEATEAKILSTEPTFNTSSNRAYFLEQMFEKNHFSAAALAASAQCSLYQQGTCLACYEC